MPSLYKALIPISKAYVNAAGYRKVGLKYDDLIIEERLDVEKVGVFGGRTGSSRGRTPGARQSVPCVWTDGYAARRCTALDGSDCDVRSAALRLRTAACGLRPPRARPCPSS